MTHTPRTSKAVFFLLGTFTFLFKDNIFFVLLYFTYFILLFFFSLRHNNMESPYCTYVVPVYSSVTRCFANDAEAPNETQRF